MLKAIFLDLDETLCDTSGANRKALVYMAETARQLLGDETDTHYLTDAYLNGIYRKLDERYSRLLLPIADEEAFRLQLIRLILQDMGIASPDENVVKKLQESFDSGRAKCFAFFPGIKELLADLRKRFTLVVITNGPEFSQVAKVNTVQLRDHVDHVIIGGQEKEEKPAVSIFNKALSLAQCNKDEAIHIGDSLKSDVAGANNSGITSVWISHDQDLDANNPVQPVHIIENPFEIRDLIDALEQKMKHTSVNIQ